MTASLYTQGLQQNCRSTYKTWQVHKLPYANGIAFPVLLARGTEKKTAGDYQNLQCVYMLTTNNMSCSRTRGTSKQQWTSA